MLGYDAEYMNNSEDNDLITSARENSRILLTSDEQLYSTAAGRGVDCFLVEGRTEAERLANLAARYGLDLRIDTAISRCPMCGSLIRETSKVEVEGLVPKATFENYEEFWVCTNPKCGKVYWQGSHWSKIEQTLQKARSILDATRTREAKKSWERPPQPRTRHRTRATGKAGDRTLSRETRDNENAGGNSKRAV